MTLNKLIILLSLDDSTPREITLSSFYKTIKFDKVYIIGKYAKRSISSKINLLKKNDDCEIVFLDTEVNNLFEYTKKHTRIEVVPEDSYQAPSVKSELNYLLDIYSANDINYFFPEPKSYFDTLHFDHQLASIVKPNHFPFFIRDKKITSLRDFKEPELYFEGLDLVKAYITAGFHIFENTENVPGWCISPNSSWISLLLSLYKVEKVTNDLMFYQEFCSIGRMRALLFYLSVNEFKKIKDLVPDMDDNDAFLGEKEERFFNEFLEDNIKEKIFDNDIGEFGKWIQLSLYDDIKEKL